MSLERKIAIIGAGAIGCVTGALLHDKGRDVTLIGRAEQVGAIRENGVVVDGVLGGRRYDVPARAALDFEPGMIVLAVKTQDVEAACRESMPWAKEAITVTMQNGVRSDEVAAGVLGRERVVSAVVMYGATWLEPGRVTYNFKHSLVIGRAFKDNPVSLNPTPATGGGAGLGAVSPDAVVERAREVLSGAFEVHVSDDVHGAHWTKLILNLNNALSGVLGTSLQETFGDPGMCRLGVLLMKEAFGAMEAAGIRLAPLPGLPVEKLRSLLYAPPDVSSGIYGGIMRGLSEYPLPGSILQSVRRGRATEVDYLNGEIAAIGRKCGYKTPLNEGMTRLVKEVEKGNGFVSKAELMKTVPFF